MPKNRQGRINDQVREALSDAVRSLKDPRISGIVSIVRCEVTGDMRYCKAYVSILGSDEQIKSAMSGLKSASGWLRRELSQRIDLRYTPEIILVHDNSIARGAHISEILNGINNGAGLTTESANENEDFIGGGDENDDTVNG